MLRLLETIYVNPPVPVFKESLYTAPTLNTNVPSIPNISPNNNRYVDNIPVDDEDENIYEFTTRYSSSEVKEEMIKPFTIGLNENVPKVS